ncbi:FadR/GntR family transcriptional regulator [Sinanaerobacter chloroacetimidivorans]|uniref:FadR family transcriptional regulator n=1 Tax=Sinanaerobacter chloroacetimidivorans TaxID=2818044 RepID=A0A8J7W1C6_9FIRM|nr:FadR/GntR family transcriptional regulator [Sinanaerobacter chloroacetimidivorans]MBR0598626.1 FadR family transcriptional regulator [Sinanaerobacter chloroacetimidivorans]
MDNFGFKNIEYKNIAQQIVDQICKAIAEGKYKPGDRIPTEQDLAKSLNVGRNSVREAIKILVAFGILEIRRAEGTFVCKTISQNMINPLIYGIILSSGNLNEEMIEFQIAIDKAMSRMCIQRYTEQDLEKLTQAYENLMETLDKKDYDLDEIYAKDKNFHEIIAESTHNEFMKMMHKSIWELLDKIIKQEIRTSLYHHEGRMREMHTQIYKAIVSKDEEAVTNAIKKNYDTQE